MIHGFAILVIVGIALALLCALTAGLATLARFSEPPPLPDDLPPLLPGGRGRLAALRPRLEGGGLDTLLGAGLLAEAVVVILVVAVIVNSLAAWVVALVLLLVVAALLALIPARRARLAQKREKPCN